LLQQNSSVDFTIPAGTTIPANGYLVIGRDATKAAFQSFWGFALPANAVYLNSAGVLPLINGDENYTLRNSGGATVDGPTINMPSSALRSLQRNDPCLAAGSASSWANVASTSGSPGSGAGVGCGRGVVINEFSDAGGTGNFVYEFVELHYDQ
jgi:hypothetical protein